MFQTCLFAISLFISFALSCNLPNVIYYSSSYKHGIPLFNDNYIPVGYYNKISNNRVYNNRYVLLFDIQTFYYYFSFYMMYFFYRLITNMLSKLLVNQSKYNKTNFLNSVIKKKTSINMNDTYYIPTYDEELEEMGNNETDEEGSCGEDCEECWERREGCGGNEGEGCGDSGNEGDGGSGNEGEGDGGSGNEGDGDGDGDGGSGNEGDGEEQEGCIECNDENCTYFSIDNKCKIKCINCEQ
jgi:hypothetical protein